MIDDNILQLRRRPCQAGPVYKFAHGPFLIDEERALILCGTCGDQLNPVHVLAAYARGEARIGDRIARLRDEVEKIRFKAERQNRVRCEHCLKLTRIKRG